MNLKSIMLAVGVLTLSAGAASAATVTNDLNLRSGPGTGYGVIATMPAGTYVDVIDCGGSWCRVDWRGNVGYASASYLAGGGGGYAVVPPPPVYYAPPATVFSFGFGSGPRYYRHDRRYDGWRNDRGHRGNRYGGYHRRDANQGGHINRYGNSRNFRGGNRGPRTGAGGRHDGSNYRTGSRQGG